MQITEKDFGQTYHLITLTNNHGTSLSVTDLGARIVSLLFNERELVLGFDSADEYINKDPYIGASIGRVAGRIEHGQFAISSKTYQAQTDPTTGHTLHGGNPGFELKKWDYQTRIEADRASVIFHLTSPDQENGFPGNLAVDVIYTLTEDDTWEVKTTGISDQATLFNPTNHVYFNLTGDVSQPIDNHTLFIESDVFAELASNSIPTGKKVPVSRTAFDFRKPKKLAEVFAADYPQKNQFNGIDHPFFLKKTGLRETAAELTSPDNEVQVSVKTDAPSLVIFTANFGEATPEMRETKLADHGGITFEAQVAPGAEQYSEFGSMLLAANHPFTTTTEFKLTSL